MPMSFKTYVTVGNSLRRTRQRLLMELEASAAVGTGMADLGVLQITVNRTFESVAYDLAQVFMKDNPRFKSERFIAGVMSDEEPVDA